MNKEYLVQITSGRGPIECKRVVELVFRILVKEAHQLNITITNPVKIPCRDLDIYHSIYFRISGRELDKFIDSWKGTICWQSFSPFRKNTKRKNWFVGIESFPVPKPQLFRMEDIEFSTMRASGPGGQHVNKTDSAVRAIHKPTGYQVVSMEARSQHQNKQTCIEKIRDKLLELNSDQEFLLSHSQWREHDALVRGSAIRTFKWKL